MSCYTLREMIANRAEAERYREDLAAVFGREDAMTKVAAEQVRRWERDIFEHQSVCNECERPGTLE